MKLYLDYFKMHFKSEMQYKTSFILSFISQFFVFFGYYFTIICLFNKFDNINGYTLYHILLVFGIIQFGHSFCETFFRGIDQFDDLIINGEFDRLLLRPKNIILQVCGFEISFIKLSRFLQSIIVLLIAIININITWNIYKIITLLFMLLSSILIFLGTIILAASYCFFTIKGLEVRNIFTDGCKHMAQYPISIFNKGFRFFFTFIVPFAFVNYYPLLYLLDIKTNKLLIISPILTIIYLIISVLVFYRGVKRYSSTGS